MWLALGVTCVLILVLFQMITLLLARKSTVKTVYRGDRSSKPPSVTLSLCLSEETLKAVGPFYLVSMPGEVKDPPQGKYVTCCELRTS